MISKVISVLVLAVLLQSSVAAQAASFPAQSVANMQQVLRNAQDKAKTVTVSLKKNVDKKTKLTGEVNEVSNAGFTITDKQTGNPITLAYEDVQQVKQKGMSTGAKVAIGIGIGVGAFIAVGVIVCYASGPCRD
jgi:hypothetical protein